VIGEPSFAFRRGQLSQRILKVLALLGVATLAGCASSRPNDLQISRRLVAIGNQLRLEAEIADDDVAAPNTIPIHYTVTNGRARPIAIADMLPDSSLDSASQLVTVTLGSDVPGENFLPRLLVVEPGASRSFEAIARIGVLPRSAADARPRTIRIALNFLGETEPFGELIGITQRAVEDPAYAAAIYPKWLRHNETVITNTIPMRDVGEPKEPDIPALRHEP
jgi:hypothetical protein